MTRTPYSPLHKTLEGKNLEGKLSRRGIFGGEFSEGNFRERNFRRGIFGGEFSERNFQGGIFGGESSLGGKFADSLGEDYGERGNPPMLKFRLMTDHDDTM
jgi:hypothetical protein